MFFWVLALLLVVVRTDCRIASTDTDVDWPSGTYGLLRAKSGCPGDNNEWHVGWRSQDMEDDSGETSRSKGSRGHHMDIKFLRGERKDVNRTFCMKENNGKRSWPKGSYCIYKKAECPKGMKSGWVKWDDEDYANNNDKKGPLPDGSYKADTTIYYCCQTQGNWYNLIELPVGKPFYLLTSSITSGPNCQMVKWALAYLEYILFDTNDDDNSDAQNGNHVLFDGPRSFRTFYYCYYKDCRRTMTDPSGSFHSYLPAIKKMDPRSQYCSWLITIAETFVVSLNFKEITIPSCGDTFIQIYDGKDDAAPLLGTYCGLNASTEVDIVSSTSSLFIVSNSGSYGRDTRSIFSFHARYHAEHLKDCHHEVIGGAGIIRSPKFNIPSNYPGHSNCTWLITMDEAYLVTLNFSSLTFVANEDEDVVEIYDGDSENAPRLAHYSRSNGYNGTLVASSSTVFIILKYGKSSTHRMDFVLDYSSQPKPTEMTTLSMTSTSVYTIITREPDNEDNKQSESTSTTYIIVAVVAGIVVVLVLIAIVIFLRRRKMKAESASDFRAINRCYSWRKKATTSDDDPLTYANPSSPQERIWVGGSRICKEGRNPIYEPSKEHEPAALYSSTDANDAPLIENRGAESKNPLYDAGGVACNLHDYAEPSSPQIQNNIVYDEPVVKV